MYIHVDFTGWLLKLYVKNMSKDCNISHNVSQGLLEGLFGDDVEWQNRLSVLVFGFADVVSKVNGLQVLYSQDTLRDPRGVPHAPVHQPPGC